MKDYSLYIHVCFYLDFLFCFLNYDKTSYHLRKLSLTNKVSDLDFLGKNKAGFLPLITNGCFFIPVRNDFLYIQLS